MLSNLSMFANLKAGHDVAGVFREVGLRDGHWPHGIKINVINLDSSTKSSKNTKGQY